MKRFNLTAAALLVTALPMLAAGEAVDWKKVLAQPIIDKNLPMEEVQRYTERRVPRLPKFESVEEWERYAERMRRDTLEKVVYRGEAARWRDADCNVVWLDEIEAGPGYVIKKLRYEALPGLWIPALLYEPTKLEGRVPVVMNVNGHDGAGKVVAYKQIRCINQAKRGMIALNVEWLGMGQLRTDDYLHYRMNQLDLCGTSGLAPFYLSMKRGLDILLSHAHADPQRVAVAGLSGGGWQTIIISSLDTRVTLTDPVAGYSSFRTRARNLSDLGDSEQTPNDLATVTDYAHLTAMMAPRATLLTFNNEDNCCFKADHALPPLLNAARPIFELYGKADRLRWHVNYAPGNHNFGRDNRQALYRMFADFFYAGDDSFDPTEISVDKEVKTKEELDIELPKSNHNFHTLALALAKNLPQTSVPSGAGQPTETWQRQRREKLKQIVSAKSYRVDAEKVADEEQGSVRVTRWKLKLGGAWTVPAVELTPESPSGTALLVADGGRASAAEQAGKLLAGGKRVVAVDPFYFGESKIAQRDFLFGLLVAAVGDRPLGLQASQLTAVARWLKDARTAGPVTVVSSGPRSSLFSLVAAALEPEAIAGLEMTGGFKSLKDVIDQNRAVNQAPELFCFGLLEEFDVDHLKALVAPRPVADK